MIMPSLFEPCGLPQMTAPLYGTLPVVHATGGLYDTIRPLDVDASTGNGFRFNHYGADSLRWAIDRAMDFHSLPPDIREREISRVMRESLVEFSHQKVAKNYIAIYEEMLARPLVEKEAGTELAKHALPAALAEMMPPAAINASQERKVRKGPQVPKGKSHLKGHGDVTGKTVPRGRS